MSGYFEGWFDPEAGTGGDGVAPTITLISPIAFDSDFTTATATPVVIDITDLSGLGSTIITAQGAGMTGTLLVVSITGQTGTVQAPFTGSVTSIADGVRVSFLLSPGWHAGDLQVFVLAVDSEGNQGYNSWEWVLEDDGAGDDSGTGFRDSVWRWRRRLARQKCSVISVAIDDDYTPGPGFTLTALSLQIARKPGLDRVAWQGGTYTNPAGSGNSSDGT